MGQPKGHPSGKATVAALVIWGCLAYTLYGVGTPIVGETVIKLIFIPFFVLLWALIPMCQKYFDGDGDDT